MISITEKHNNKNKLMGSLRKNRAEILAPEELDDLKSIYTMRQVGDLAGLRHTPPARRLFGNFFFEGELCMLFSGANKGKSILAVQIADALSKGIDCAGFKNEAGAQAVAFFDFELTDKQFFERYISQSNREIYHQFSPNFWRAGVTHPKAKSAKEAARKMLLALRYCIERTTAKILIIDNLTRIAGDIAEGAAAFEVVTFLDQLKKDGYSIFMLGHTKKGEQDKYGISSNDALGSSMINNFVDSAFCIGSNASNASARYLKQTKARNCELSDDVFVFEIEKKNDTFLSFGYRGLTTEQEQLTQQTAEERQTLEADILQMHRGNPAATLNNIARQINESGQYKQKIYPTTVSRIIAKAAAQEAVERAEQAEQAEDEKDLMPF